LNIKGKLVYKVGAQSYWALVCSADGSQLQLLMYKACAHGSCTLFFY